MNNQANYESVVQTLYDASNDNGLVPTLHTAFKGAFTVEIPLTSKTCVASVDELELSARSQNCLKRAGIMTIGSLVAIISSEELLTLRNLGRKSYNEIKTKLLAFGYSALTESGKKNFWRNILKDNCSAYKMRSENDFHST